MILKIGSKGDYVITLQHFLNITPDGDFGPKTEAAVKKWQSENGLVADGIVGPITYSKMGLISTDLSTNQNPLVQSDLEDFMLDSDEYFMGPTKKTHLFLHHTAGWDNPHGTIKAWNDDTRGAIATEFVVGGQNIKGTSTKYDGHIARSFPKGGYAWHLGTGNSPMHRNSIGIETCSFGQIVDGKNYVGIVADSSQIGKLAKPFRGYTYFHKYSDAQINSIKQIILEAGSVEGIDILSGLPKLIKTMGADAFDVYNVAMCEKTPGIWAHSNVRKDKVDMFPQQELIDMLLSL